MSTSNMNPFPGLRSFDYEESHLFFGREKHISDLLRKLSHNRFVAIVGTSGSGKSSLVRAGLLPAIHNGRLSTDGTDWLITTLKPGNAAVANLARSLISKNVFATGNAERDDSELQHVDKLLRASRLGLIQAVRSLLPPKKNLLLLLDQFEETFRFSGEGMEHNDEDSTQFVNLIIDAVRQRDVPIYVVLTIRSDFLGDCARFEGLPEAINDGHYLVPRLTTEQNKSVITGPVNYAMGKISPRLVQRVVNDLGDNPDQLPVLQHALMRTWDVWKSTAEAGEPMDLRHYELIGGMEHALSNHADEAFNELDESQQKLIEHIFKCLTVKTGENRGVRRPTTIRRLMEITGASFVDLEKTLRPFRIAGRTFILPAADIPLTENAVMDISHESLMRAWERLKHWVDEEAESASVYSRLCESAVLHRAGKAALWRNPELQMALDWKAKSEPNEAWSAQYNEHFREGMQFLEASYKEDLAEKTRMNRRKRAVRAAVTTFLIVVSLLSAWALFQTKEAKTQSVLADKNRIEAEQKALEAINQKQLAEKAKEMALEASQKAMDAKSYAELQSKIAGEQKKLADEQKTKAEQEALRASQQQQLAERKSAEALSEKQKADSAENQATRLRLISVGQNIAFKSLQQKEDAQLAALLASQSYKMISENNGNVNDNQLYNALFNASQKIESSYKPVVIRESVDVAALNATGGNVSALFVNGDFKNYSSTNFTAGDKKQLGGDAASINTSYFSDNGKFAAVGAEDNTVLIYDLKNISQPNILSGHSGLVRAVAFSSNSTLIATGGRDSTVIIWENHARSKKLKCNARVKSLAFSNVNSNLFIGTEDGRISQYVPGSDDKQNFASGNGRVQAIQCSASGKIIAAGYSSGAIQLLNSKGHVTRTLNESGSVDFIILDEGNDLIITATANKMIHLYHLSDLSLKPIEINCSSSINAIASNGDLIYAACSDKTIRMYPVHTSWFERILSASIKRDFTKDEWNLHIGADVEKR